jgi:hypothetical protein
MNFLQLIDDYVLERVFQRFSNWFQRLTGYDCFCLARLALLLTSASLCIMPLLVGLPYMLAISVPGAFASFVMGNSIIKEGQDSVGKGETKNKLAVSHDWFIRPFSVIACFAVMPLFCCSYLVSAPLCVIEAACFLHLSACTPDPPSKSKIRELREKLSSAFQQEHLSEPMPA